jgi:short-subunit dehydrogenase
VRPPIDGSVTLITGASSGLGADFARQLAPRVKTLVLVARRTERLEKLKAELVAKHPALVVSLQPCDLADRVATDALLGRVEKEVGAIDVLINNAGLGDIGVFELAAWPKLLQMIEVNVTALVYLTHRVLPGMIARGRGGILNVSSSAGLHFLPGFATYAATKNFVTAFTEGVRIEARKGGVVMSQLCPGPVATEFEAVASNVPGLEVPSALELSSERCVRWAIAKFSRGKALIVPGYLMILTNFFGGMVPRWLKRFVLGLAIGRLRQHQLRSAERPPQAG